MEVDKIKELVEMMKANDLSELEIVDGQTRIMLKRGQEPTVQQVVAMPSVVAPGNGVHSGGTAAAPATSEAAPSEDDNLLEIISPIVGTLYVAPSPEAEAFVEVGSHVDEDTVVCIIEAMKVMNEVKSEVTGTIKKMLVSNGQSVEYGQAMYLVEPD